MMNLGYFAADTLGMTLYQQKNKLVSNETHQITFGPWRIEMTIDVQSDVMTGTEMGFWVTLSKKLRLYLIVRESENWLFVLDEAKLKECGKRTGFAGDTLKARILEIKPALKGVFQWKHKTWAQVESFAKS